MKRSLMKILFAIMALALLACGTLQASEENSMIECANLIYAGTRSSVCFSDKFLPAMARETSVRTVCRFKPVKLAGQEIFGHPFCIMTGEGSFTLNQGERDNLKTYLSQGGFLLASAGCSNEEWDESFRKEIKEIFPERELSNIDISHPLFSTVFPIRRLETKGEDAHLEGMEISGKIVLIYSADGLNDTGTMHGCCCCGGNEIKNSQEVNVNILTYALLQ